MGSARSIKEVLESIDASLASTVTTSKALHKEEQKLSEAFQDNAKALERLDKELKDGLIGLKKYAELKKAEKKLLDEVRKKYKDQLEIEKKYREELKKVNKEVEETVKGFKKVKAIIGSSAGITSTFVGSFNKLSGALGIATLSFSGIVKIGIDYKRSLFEIMQVQGSVGKTSASMSVALKDVKDNTSLASIEFLELVKIIQKGYLGLKPNFLEMAKLVKMVGQQFGPSVEAQKEGLSSLMGIQSQFPSLYADIMKAREALDKAEKGEALSENQKQGISLLESQIARYAELKVISQEQATAGLQTLVQQNAETLKLNDELKKIQKTHKAVKDAALDLWKSLEPFVLAIFVAIKKTYEILLPFKEVIMTVGAAFLVWKTATTMLAGIQTLLVACTSAQWALNLATAANPYIAVATVIIAALAGAYLWYKKIKGSQEEANKIAEEQSKTQEELKILTAEEKKLYDEKMEVAVKDNKLAKDSRGTHIEILQSVKAESKTAKDLALDSSRITQDMNTRLDIQKRITGSLETQLAMIQKFGGTSKSVMDTLVERTKKASEEINESLFIGLQSLQKSLKEQGVNIPINFDGNIMDEALAFLEEVNKLSSKQIPDAIRLENIKKSQANIQETINKKTQIESDIISKSYETELRYVKQMEEKTSVYEQRLNTERQLMESAQFGLGASVDMMQKQVDLAYEMMKTYEEANESLAKRAKLLGDVGDEELAIIRSCKTQREAENYILSIKGKQTKEATALNEYATQYQEISNKTMQQQQKIYDLTKEVREGYLDAIREMSVGAGEFSTIIGKQEMGVTQLMGMVKNVSGEAALNTMKLGGEQSKALTAMGVGTGYAAQYGMQGLRTGDKGIEAAKLGRLRDPTGTLKKSLEELREDITGKVGTGVAASDNDIAALRESATVQGKVQGPIIAEELVKELKRNWMQERNWMQGVMGKPGDRLPAQSGIPSDYSGGPAAANLGAKQAASAKGGVALPQGGPNLAPGPMPAMSGQRPAPAAPEKIDNISKMLQMAFPELKNIKFEFIKEADLRKDIVSVFDKELTLTKTKLALITRSVEWHKKQGFDERQYSDLQSRQKDMQIKVDRLEDLNINNRRRLKNETLTRKTNIGKGGVNQEVSIKEPGIYTRIGGNRFDKVGNTEDKIKLQERKVQFERERVEKGTSRADILKGTSRADKLLAKGAGPEGEKKQRTYNRSLQKKLAEEEEKLVKMVASAKKGAEEEAIKARSTISSRNKAGVLESKVVRPEAKVETSEEQEAKVETSEEQKAKVAQQAYSAEVTRMAVKMREEVGVVKPRGERIKDRKAGGPYTRDIESQKDATKRAITSKVMRETDFSKMSEADIVKAKQAREQASGMPLKEAQKAAKGVEVLERKQAISKEQRDNPQATVEEQAKMQDLKTSGQTSEQYGLGTGADSIMASMAADIAQMKKSLINIENNGMAVKV
jgi:hypothetical protein